MVVSGEVGGTGTEGVGKGVPVSPAAERTRS